MSGIKTRSAAKSLVTSNLPGGTGGVTAANHREVENAILDSAVLFGEAEVRVIDMTTTAPPGSPSDRDQYVVASGGSGDWSGKDGQIAVWDASVSPPAWFYVTPTDGQPVYNLDDSTVYRWDASASPAAWVAESAGGGASKASTAEILDGTDNKYVSPAGIDAALAPVTLTDAATIAVDMDTGRNFKVTLGGNRTMGAPTNITAGRSGVLALTQDGTGSRTVTWNAAYEFIDGTAPTLSTTAGETDTFTYFCPDSSTVQIAHIGVFS